MVFQKRQLMAHFPHSTSIEKIYFYLVLHQQLVSALTACETLCTLAAQWLAG